MGKRITDEKKAVVKTLVDAGVGYRAIQDIVDVSLGGISKIIREFEGDKELTKRYKNNRADILAHDQAIYRSHITTEKLKKASARDLELMRCMAYDKERLERGQSNCNIAVIIERIEAIQREAQE